MLLKVQELNGRRKKTTKTKIFYSDENLSMQNLVFNKLEYAVHCMW